MTLIPSNFFYVYKAPYHKVLGINIMYNKHIRKGPRKQVTMRERHVDLGRDALTIMSHDTTKDITHVKQLQDD